MTSDGAEEFAVTGAAGGFPVVRMTIVKRLWTCSRIEAPTLCPTRRDVTHDRVGSMSGAALPEPFLTPAPFAPLAAFAACLV